jgi:nucleoside 2-deoxyribosyltransferase
MKNAYLACGLTHVPNSVFNEYVDVIHGIASATRSMVDGLSVRYALVDSDPQLEKRNQEDKARLCYLWDRQMVEEADIVIAEASFPSTGLGIELQIAEANDTPILLLFKDYGCNRAAERHYSNPEDPEHHTLQIGEGFVTLMALGMPSVFRVIQYESIEDCKRQLASALLLLEKDG